MWVEATGLGFVLFFKAYMCFIVNGVDLGFFFCYFLYLAPPPQPAASLRTVPQASTSQDHAPRTATPHALVSEFCCGFCKRRIVFCEITLWLWANYASCVFKSTITPSHLFLVLASLRSIGLGFPCSIWESHKVLKIPTEIMRTQLKAPSYSLLLYLCEFNFVQIFKFVFVLNVPSFPKLYIYLYMCFFKIYLSFCSNAVYKPLIILVFMSLCFELVFYSSFISFVLL